MKSSLFALLIAVISFKRVFSSTVSYKIQRDSHQYVESFAHRVSTNVVARFENRITHHSAADRIQPRHSDVLRLLQAILKTYTAAETSESDDRRQRVGSMMQRVGVQNIAIVLFSESIRPLIDELRSLEGTA